MLPRTPLLAVIAILSFAPPTAVAGGTHGGPEPEPFDPLVFQMDRWFAFSGDLVDAAPASEERVPLPPAQPGAAPAAVAWKGVAPIAFSQRTPFRLDLTIDVDAPALATDPATGKGVEVALAVNGVVVEDTVQTLDIPGPILTPGRSTIALGISAPGIAFAKGDTIEILVTSYVPHAQAVLHVVTGGASGSLLRAKIALPDAAALEIASGGFPVVTAAGFAYKPPAGAKAFTVTIDHARVAAPAIEIERGQKLILVLVGDEIPDDALPAHGSLDTATRAAAAHAFTIAGNRVATHPGIAVVASFSPAANTTLSCAANCPGGAFSLPIVVRGPAREPASEEMAPSESAPQASESQERALPALPGLVAAGTAVATALAVGLRARAR